MTVEELRERYEMNSQKDVVDFIKEHFEDINAAGTHAQLKGGTWQVDRKGVDILDRLLDYDGNRETKQNEATALEEMKKQLEEAKATAAEYEKQLEEVKATAEESRTEFLQMHEKFQLLQEESSGANTKVIRKYKATEERLSRELDAAKKNYEETTRIHKTRIAELEERNRELQEKLTNETELQKEHNELNFKILEGRKERDRLFGELKDCEERISALEKSIELEKAAKEDALGLYRQLQEDVKNYLRDAVRLTKRLDAAVDETEDGKEEKADGATENQTNIAVTNTAEESNAEFYGKNTSTVQTERDGLFAKLREGQQAAKDEERADGKKGFLKSFMSKAASFF